jgi:tetratricopeptide (TPR) repeat protein
MAHTNIGLVFLQKGKIDDAIAHYRSALQMQPDSWDAEYNLGTALWERPGGRGDPACEKAVAMRPTDPDAQVSWAMPSFKRAGLTTQSLITKRQ